VISDWSKFVREIMKLLICVVSRYVEYVIKMPLTGILHQFKFL